MHCRSLQHHCVKSYQLQGFQSRCWWKHLYLYTLFLMQKFAHVAVKGEWLLVYWPACQAQCCTSWSDSCTCAQCLCLLPAHTSLILSMQELLACILQRLQGLLETLVADGFGPLQEAYLHAWLHTNQQVVLSFKRWHSMPSAYVTSCTGQM